MQSFSRKPSDMNSAVNRQFRRGVAKLTYSIAAIAIITCHDLSWPITVMVIGMLKFVVIIAIMYYYVLSIVLMLFRLYQSRCPCMHVPILCRGSQIRWRRCSGTMAVRAIHGQCWGKNLFL